MTSRRPTLEPAYFEAIYARDADPWRFRTSRYEADKYAATLKILDERRYGRALEVGCSIGVFTRQLAERCDRLLSIDVSERALAIARQDCSDLAQVEFRRASIPAEFPDGTFDLILLSEVLYYLSADDLRRAADSVIDHLRPGGDVVVCHWLGETDYPLTGDDASRMFIDATIKRLRPRSASRQSEYRLDKLSSEPADPPHAGSTTGDGRA